jgi:hypothetical protein
VTVLEDDFALSREDPDAVDEPRFVTLGLSNLGVASKTSVRGDSMRKS